MVDFPPYNPLLCVHFQYCYIFVVSITSLSSSSLSTESFSLLRSYLISKSFSIDIISVQLKKYIWLFNINKWNSHYFDVLELVFFCIINYLLKSSSPSSLSSFSFHANRIQLLVFCFILLDFLSNFAFFHCLFVYNIMASRIIQLELSIH